MEKSGVDRLCKRVIKRRGKMESKIRRAEERVGQSEEWGESEEWEENEQWKEEQ